MILIPSIYFLLNLLHAWYHKYLADVKNKTISSTQKTFEYSLLSFVLFWIIVGVDKLYNLSGESLLPPLLFPILTRAALFDTMLNLLRGKGILYEGEIKKRKSWVDWLENKIGLPTWVYRIVYLVVYIVYLIIFLWN